MNLSKKKLLDYYIGGPLIVLLRLIAPVLGYALKRDHSSKADGKTLIIKMLGGGSLLLALPALLGIKQSCKGSLYLLTTKDVKPFADLMGIFDEVIIIDDKNIFNLCSSSLLALKKLFAVDNSLDFEVHSRLTTVFSTILCGKNRFGFYRENVFWRTSLYTHLSFFNLFGGSFYFYEELARMRGAKIATTDQCFNWIYTKLSLDRSVKTADLERPINIAIGPCCSDLGKERMLTPSQWKTFAKTELKNEKKYRIYFLGSEKDFDFCNQIRIELQSLRDDLELINHCGQFNLIKSVQKLYQADIFWGIDSSLLHFARLLKIESVSFWGPTAPHTRLKKIDNYKERIIYQKVECSPCVHVTETPPCKGDNKCIYGLFELEASRFR